MKKPLQYEHIVDILSERVPEFGGFTDAYRDRDLPQVVFGRFGKFVSQQIALGRSSGDMKSAFDLLNEMSEADDLRVRILAQTGAMEALIESPAAVEMARHLLFGRALDDLEDVLRG